MKYYEAHLKYYSNVSCLKHSVSCLAFIFKYLFFTCLFINFNQNISEGDFSSLPANIYLFIYYLWFMVYDLSYPHSFIEQKYILFYLRNQSNKSHILAINNHQMLAPFNSLLTRAAIQAKSHTTLKEQQIKYKDRSTLIKVKSKEIQKEIREITQKQKYLARVLKNIIKQKLKDILTKITYHVSFKKISYAFLTGKAKRNMTDAFIIIKNYNFKRQNKIFSNFISLHKQPKMMQILLMKFIRKILQKSYEKIRKYSIKKRLLEKIVKILDISINNFIIRQFYAPTINLIKDCEANHLYKIKNLKKILTIDQLRLTRIKQLAFNKIVFSQFIEGVMKNVDQKKNKISQILTLKNNRKEVFQVLKEKIKNLKLEVQQEKLIKNRLINERRKNTQNSKNVNSQALKAYQKQKLSIMQENQQLQIIFLKENQRLLRLRQQSIIKSKHSNQNTLTIYKSIFEEEKEEIRDLQRHIPFIQKQLNQFKCQSAQYLFFENTKLSSKVFLYEKLQQPTLNQEYYELEHQNKVLKEMIKCIMHHISYDHVYVKVQDQRKQQIKETGELEDEEDIKINIKMA